MLTAPMLPVAAMPLAPPMLKVLPLLNVRLPLPALAMSTARVLTILVPSKLTPPGNLGTPGLTSPLMLRVLAVIAAERSSVIPLPAAKSTLPLVERPELTPKLILPTPDVTAKPVLFQPETKLKSPGPLTTAEAEKFMSLCAFKVNVLAWVSVAPVRILMLPVPLVLSASV